MNSTTVQTTSGLVEGYVHKSIQVWKGIPFAKAPVGELRFMPPQPLEPWAGVRAAKEFGPASIQGEDRLMVGLTGRAKLAESEDCLYLNIWSPAADGKKRPVMVWIHGGAYVTGAGSIAWYDGSSFAEIGDVVVVTLNYRLGALGFLYLREWLGDEFANSGNLGLLDQVAALRWIHDNIAQFGGDPERVTIFGESAGAGSIGALLAMPKAGGLFQQAILQSGSGSLGIRTTEEASSISKQVLDAAGVRPGDLDALRSIPANQLVNAASAIGVPLPFGPVIDGDSLPVHPLQALEHGHAADLRTIIGINKDEYRLFTIADPGWYTADEDALRGRIKALGHCTRCID